MDARKAKELSRQGGFTLVEVMIALMILVSDGSIMIGLQSAAVSRTLRDKQAQHAMLAARTIMAMIEQSGDQLPLSNQEGTPLLAVLQQLELPAPTSDEQRALYESLRVFLNIQPWDLPFQNMTSNAMQKLSLGIAWSERPQDRFLVEYLIPSPEPNPQ